jgi:hypothetical protein
MYAWTAASHVSLLTLVASATPHWLHLLLLQGADSERKKSVALGVVCIMIKVG